MAPHAVKTYKIVIGLIYVSFNEIRSKSVQIFLAFIGYIFSRSNETNSYLGKKILLIQNFNEFQYSPVTEAVIWYFSSIGWEKTDFHETW